MREARITVDPRTDPSGLERDPPHGCGGLPVWQAPAVVSVAVREYARTGSVQGLHCSALSWPVGASAVPRPPSSYDLPQR